MFNFLLNTFSKVRSKFRFVIREAQCPNAAAARKKRIYEWNRNKIWSMLSQIVVYGKIFPTIRHEICPQSSFSLNPNKKGAYSNQIRKHKTQCVSYTPSLMSWLMNIKYSYMKVRPCTRKYMEILEILT